MAQQRHMQIFALPPPPQPPLLPPQHRQPPLRQSPLPPPPFFCPLMELPPPPPPPPPVGIYGLHHINVDHLNDVCVLRSIVRQLQTSGREDKNERRRLLRELQDERTARRNMKVEYQEDTRPQDFQCAPVCPHCGRRRNYYINVNQQAMIDTDRMSGVNRGSLM
ncbi:atherin-like isoform X2 [Clytia hemisphaerica]|uniref:atherin-like isoform X2 n=1 Tax=Clytia hemisphaerica TaxID=252671 RepID=UPI0034D43393